MVVTQTIWNLDPHTKAKHDILKRYLDAWFPILSKYRRVNYIDCFAGPGIYSKGEEGSPIIAIKSLIHHKMIKHLKGTEFNFIFIESDKKRNDCLKEELTKISVPLEIKLKKEVVHGEFEYEIKQLLDKIETDKTSLAPTFFFIDPFGFSGVPMILIKRILACKTCEVLINVMYEDITRFYALASNENHLNSLFGTDTWKIILNDKGLTSQEKLIGLRDLYGHQLKSFADAKFTLSFLMINKFNKADYFLFFGTNNELGLTKMKESMWKVDGCGKFNFSDFDYDPKQSLLFNDKPNYTILKNQILSKFKCKTTTIEDLELFVNRETLFLKSYIRKGVLNPLEESKEIQVLCEGKRAKSQYPSGRTKIQFN